MRLIIDPTWQDQLKEAGLDTVEALLSFSNDHCVSQHPRGATWRHTLPNGQVIFLKRVYYTSPGTLLRLLCRGYLPETTTERECHLLAHAESLGFRVPKIIAHTEHCRWLPPRQGVMVELALKGRAVDDIARDPAIPAAEKHRALNKARDVLNALQDARIDWMKDCKPEHFFLCDDGEIALIDGERLFPRKRPLTPKYRLWQHQRFDSLLPEEFRSRQ